MNPSLSVCRKKVLHSWICKTSLSGWKLRCKIFAKISISSPYNPKKKSSEKKMFKTKVVDNFTLYLAIFFYFDEIAKMWVWQPKMSCWVLSEVIFWPKFLQINRALSKLFMHMKTHFSSISFYLDLSLCEFYAILAEFTTLNNSCLQCNKVYFIAHEP